MKEVAAVASLATEAWARRRRRTRQLVERHAFAADLLRLYEALLDVQEPAFLRARDDRPEPARLGGYIAGRLMREVADATATAGPPVLAAAIRDRLRDDEPAGFVARWLAGERQAPVDEYLARAASAPVLEALGPAAGGACSGGTRRRRLSALRRPAAALVPDRCRRDPGERAAPAPVLPLRRQLGVPADDVAGCGEQSTNRLPIFADAERFPHLRADACEACRRYLITIDLRKDLRRCRSSTSSRRSRSISTSRSAASPRSCPI